MKNKSKNMPIEQVLVKIDNKAIKKIVQAPLKGYGIILSGVVLFVLSYYVDATVLNGFSPLFIILSVALIMWGSIDTFIPHVFFKDTRTGEFISFTESYFEKADHSKLVSILETGELDGINNLHHSNKQGVKLRVAHNNDNSICLVQVLKYIEYDFAITSEVKRLTRQQAELLLTLLIQPVDLLSNSGVLA